MKRVFSIALAGTLATSLPVFADSLLLRMEQSTVAGSKDFTLLGAQSGSFRHQPGLTTAGQDYLLLVGRDAQGHTLFELPVDNPGRLHAEGFSLQSGQIEFVRDILRPRAYFEVSVPNPAGLDSVVVVPRHANGNGFAEGGRVFDRQTLDAALQRKRISEGSFAATATDLHVSGPAAQRMDIVLIGDGYTGAEMTKWAADAQRVTDGLLADPLFAAHKNQMNIRRVDVVSAESGVDEPDKNIYKNTALGVQISCYGLDRLVCADEDLVYGAISPVLAADARDVIVVIANSTRYGGAGGNIATMTMHPSATELALHEIGHTAFKLADEYDYGTCDTSQEPAQANVTMQTNRASIKWGSLIDASTPVPTPTGTYANGTVGLFAGGQYCKTGKYRPTENSRMRALGQPWHAVNERRAAAVFDAYSGGGSNNGPFTVNGSLSVGQSVNIPNGTSYRSNSGGQFTLQLTGPASADFNLYLYRWSGSAWALVAQATGPGANETLQYNGSPGYYYAKIRASSGSGAYTLKYTFPR